MGKSTQESKTDIIMIISDWKTGLLSSAIIQVPARLHCRGWNLLASVVIRAKKVELTRICHRPDGSRGWNLLASIIVWTEVEGGEGFLVVGSRTAACHLVRLLSFTQKIIKSDTKKSI